MKHTLQYLFIITCLIVTLYPIWLAWDYLRRKTI